MAANPTGGKSLIGAIGLGGSTDQPVSQADVTACLAQLGVGISTIADLQFEGNEIEARGGIAAAQTMRLATINKQEGAEYSTLNEAVQDGAGGAYDGALNKTANKAKHHFKS